MPLTPEGHISVAVITGSAGLVGSEAVRHFAGKGLHVVGIDNDMRRYFFGPEGSTEPLEKRAHLFPSFAEYEKFPEKEPVEELAAAAQSSPFFSREP